MDPKWSQNGANMEPKSMKMCQKNDYEKRSISRHPFLSNFDDFGAIFGSVFQQFLCFFPRIRKKADMRFDCAMASGLRVGPTKIEPTLTKKHSEIDLEKKYLNKC